VSEIKRRKGESFEAFLRRVKRRWQQSGKLLQARKIQYFEPAKNRNARRKSAIRRTEIVSKMEYLRKIGKLPEEEQFGHNRGPRR
jgi:ribosomal protein S21